MGRYAALGAISMATLFAAACGGAHAQVLMPESVPLAVPAAPPHVVVPAAPDAPPPISLDAPITSPGTVPGGTSRRGVDPLPRPAAPPPAQPTPPVTPPAAPPAQTPTLEAAPNQGELEQRARTLKDAAEKALEKVDYSKLGGDARAQYDTAKRFLKQADEALKAKNIVYAWQLADKANTIATLLK